MRQKPLNKCSLPLANELPAAFSEYRKHVGLAVLSFGRVEGVVAFHLRAPLLTGSQPSSIHASTSARRQRTSAPTFNGRGIRPESARR